MQERKEFDANRRRTVENLFEPKIYRYSVFELLEGLLFRLRIQTVAMEERMREELRSQIKKEQL